LSKDDFQLPIIGNEVEIAPAYNSIKQKAMTFAKICY